MRKLIQSKNTHKKKKIKTLAMEIKETPTNGLRDSEALTLGNRGNTW